MTIRAGAFGNTNAQTATDTSQDFQLDATVPDKRFANIVTATVPVFLCRTEGNAESATAATSSNSMFIPANVPYLVEGVAGDWYSWIRSGSDDGNLYFTAVDGR